MPGLYFNILKTEKMLQSSTKYSLRAWHVIPAQEVKLLNIRDRIVRVFSQSPYFIGGFVGSVSQNFVGNHVTTHACLPIPDPRLHLSFPASPSDSFTLFHRDVVGRGFRNGQNDTTIRTRIRCSLLQGTRWTNRMIQSFLLYQYGNSLYSTPRRTAKSKLAVAR